VRIRIVFAFFIVSFLCFAPPTTGDKHNLCKALRFCKRFLKEKEKKAGSPLFMGLPA
jgi:hypothetical protein